MPKDPHLLILAAISGLAAAPCHAAISYSTFGGTASQNFDGLISSSTATWTNDMTLPGWYARIGSSDYTTYRASTGSTFYLGELLSLGNSSDRALGSQTAAVNGNTALIGVAYQNNTGTALTQFTLNYTGETWRDAPGNSNTDGFTFQYQIFDSNMGSLSATGTWTTVAALEFSVPNDSSSGSGAGVVGNDSDHRTVLNATVSGINWQNGQEIWYRWIDKSTAQDAVGIDDFSFSAVPEPSSAALLGLSALLAFVRRRG